VKGVISHLTQILSYTQLSKKHGDDDRAFCCM